MILLLSYTIPIVVIIHFLGQHLHMLQRVGHKARAECFPWCMPLLHRTLCSHYHPLNNSSPLLALSSLRLGKCCCFYSLCQSLASCKTIYVWQSASSLETPSVWHRGWALPARMSHPQELTRGTGLGHTMGTTEGCTPKHMAVTIRATWTDLNDFKHCRNPVTLQS